MKPSSRIMLIMAENAEINNGEDAQKQFNSALLQYLDEQEENK